VAGGAVRVGSGLGRVPGYHVQLLAGSTLLSEGTSLNPNDGFLSSAVSYIALAGNSLIGQHLKIVLISNGSQVNFDNVRLDATSLDLAPTPVSNPEPATLIMWGMGILGLAGWARGRGPTLD
jgi:hypothetical protein